MSTAKTVPVTIPNIHKFFLDAYPDPSCSSRRTEIVALLENVKEISEKRGQATAEAKTTTHTMNTRPNTQVISERVKHVLLRIQEQEAEVAELRAY